jgi:hypothetical protein
MCVGSWAWACTSTPVIQVTGPRIWPSVPANSVPSASASKVSGWNFPSSANGAGTGRPANSAPVEFRLVAVNLSSTDQGVVVSTAMPGTDGTFSAPLPIPDVAPGPYLVRAMQAGEQLSVVAVNITPKDGAGAGLPSLASTTGSADNLWSGVPHSSPASNLPIAIGLVIALGGLGSAGALLLMRPETMPVDSRRRGQERR